MKYAFVGTMVPEEMIEELLSISEKNMQDAANALQWNIYNGLCENLNEEIKLINTLPMGSYPQYCKKAFVRKSVFSSKYCDKNVNIGFCNIKLIRNYFQSKAIMKELKYWVETSSEEKTIFVYTASPVFLRAVSKIKKLYPKIVVCDIIADLPAFSGLSSKKTYISNAFVKYMAFKSSKYMEDMDCFVLLTEQMADYLNINNHFCVMEGIIDDFDKNSENIIKNHDDNDVKIVFYSGTLHKKFGIMELLMAFRLIDNENYILQICGVGDCEEEIIKYAQKDNRIQFLGRLSRKKVCELQKNATVLVNPRKNNEEFTRYSFPSKNLEYLSSGVPVIGYKLDGIPDEYDQHIYYVDNDSVETLKNKIICICEMSPNDRISKAKRAQEFVCNKKNKIVQTKKIINLLAKVWGEFYENKD